jgi:hypothetical protein
VTRLIDRVTNILVELKRLQNDRSFLRDPESPPGLIHAGSEGGIWVNRLIEQEIGEVAHLLQHNEAFASRQFSAEEWRRIVRRAFGPPLAEAISRLNPIEGAEFVLREVKCAVADAQVNCGIRDYSVGCSLFRNADVAPITIGPVSFETRKYWLTRAVDEGMVSPISARRIEQQWRTGKKPRERKRYVDQRLEADIVEAIGTYPYVCSISTDGLATVFLRRPDWSTSDEICKARSRL